MAAPTYLGYHGEPGSTHLPYEQGVVEVVVAGAAAGDITVTGIKTTDILMHVIVVSAAGIDLVSEFSITAANTINNGGGTSTSGKTVKVVYKHPPIGLTGVA